MKNEQSIDSLLSTGQSQEKINKKLFESKKYIMFSLIFILLVILSIIIIFYILLLSLQKNNRELSEYNTNSINIYDTNEKKAKSEDELEDFDPVSVILLVCYVIFIFLSLYIICQLRTLTVPTEEVQYEVIKFMYMSNNGYLVVSIIDTSISNMPTIVIGIDGISGLIFIVGTIIYIVKFLKVIVTGFFDKYFSFDMLATWYTLPCKSVWPFMILTDPCCYQNTYTEFHYSDGTVSDTKDCVICFNKFMYFLKRFAFIVSTITYYFFLIVITFYWMIIKLILLLIENIKSSGKNSQKQNKVINQNIKNQGNPPITIAVYGNTQTNNNFKTNNINYNNANNNNMLHMRRNKSNIGFTSRSGIINPSNSVNSVEALQKRNTVNKNTDIRRRTYVRNNNVNNNLGSSINVNQNLNNNINVQKQDINSNQNLNNSRRININRSIITNQNTNNIQNINNNQNEYNNNLNINTNQNPNNIQNININRSRQTYNNRRSQYLQRSRMQENAKEKDINHILDKPNYNTPRGKDVNNRINNGNNNNEVEKDIIYGNKRNNENKINITNDPRYNEIPAPLSETQK